MNKYLVIIIAILIQNVCGDKYGGLYPRESESREVKTLDGVWDFRLSPTDNPNLGFDEKWYEKPLRLTGNTIRMAVPSSYNDVTQYKELHDHVGWAWYGRDFFVPRRWAYNGQRIVVRVGSAHYNSIMYINGVEVASHEGGHLPFDAEISGQVTSDQRNWITICINNTLTPLTIPQGELVYYNDTTRYPPGYFVLDYDFDFFNYAGIHRSVHLYTTPPVYIEDISLLTDIVNGSGIIDYTISVNNNNNSESEWNCSVEIYDKSDVIVKTSDSCQGEMIIERPNLWWPYLMADDPGYQYTMKAYVVTSLGQTDAYPQKIGIRKLEWNSTTFTINGEPLYLKGFGKHEDFNIVGKGLTYPLIVKDFSLLKWMGANSFRTSHYPYAEEIMDMADNEGIMVVDETPAVGLRHFGYDLMLKHKVVLEEMYRRDKNRPSVVMWSLANEPESDNPHAGPYFRNLSDHMRSMDTTRPLTVAIVEAAGPLTDHASQTMDIIMLNRYFGWYTDTGHTEVITLQTETTFERWFNSYNKPMMMSEYGADTISGLHLNPFSAWSEEYQVQLMTENFKSFDFLRESGYFCGEMIWNFADFATKEGINRVGGNKKGVLSRERQPKLSANVLRERYHSLSNKTTKTSSSYNKALV